MLKEDCFEQKSFAAAAVLKDEKVLAAPLISVSSTPTLEILRNTMICQESTGKFCFDHSHEELINKKKLE